MERSEKVDDKAIAKSPIFIAKSAIIDGKYFTVIEFSDDSVKIKAECNMCVTKTVISGSTNSLSNFTTHLKVGYYFLFNIQHLLKFYFKFYYLQFIFCTTHFFTYLKTVVWWSVVTWVQPNQLLSLVNP
jgi:hypothetical protein